MLQEVEMDSGVDTQNKYTEKIAKIRRYWGFKSYLSTSRNLEVQFTN